MAEFTHIGSDGRAAMVDVGGKPVTKRIARARGFVRMASETLDLIRKGLLPKGDPFEAARIAGIMAAKQTPSLIPLCHPLRCTYIDIAIGIDDSGRGIAITSEVRVEDRTGAEMEAITGVAVAALTVYDMCKAVDASMVIEGIELVEKSGGKTHFIKS
ncbi:MAG: cyclic pyranopterin monophosphate synthase MoaC [Spirochaetes bacterium]|nr:cyclic pyranopterin monophosphate synthase MoaC [Spirochaetota bacterium]